MISCAVHLIEPIQKPIKLYGNIILILGFQRSLITNLSSRRPSTMASNSCHTATRAGRLGTINSGSCCDVAAATVDDFPVAVQIGHGCFLLLQCVRTYFWLYLTYKLPQKNGNICNSIQTFADRFGAKPSLPHIYNI